MAFIDFSYERERKRVVLGGKKLLKGPKDPVDHDELPIEWSIPFVVGSFVIRSCMAVSTRSKIHCDMTSSHFMSVRQSLELLFHR